MPFDAAQSEDTNLLMKLREVRKLIGAGWVKGLSCADQFGNPTMLNDATRFCLTGAIHRVAVLTDNVSDDCMNIIARAIKPRLSPDVLRVVVSDNRDTIQCWNDKSGRTHEEVLKLLDHIITVEEMKAKRPKIDCYALLDGRV